MLICARPCVAKIQTVGYFYKIKRKKNNLSGIKQNKQVHNIIAQRNMPVAA